MLPAPAPDQDLGALEPLPREAVCRPSKPRPKKCNSARRLCEIMVDGLLRHYVTSGMTWTKFREMYPDITREEFFDLENNPDKFGPNKLCGMCEALGVDVVQLIAIAAKGPRR